VGDTIISDDESFKEPNDFSVFWEGSLIKRLSWVQLPCFPRLMVFHVGPLQTLHEVTFSVWAIVSFGRDGKFTPHLFIKGVKNLV
jgi:hypothetical protein